jgi:hypothetical protein
MRICDENIIKTAYCNQRRYDSSDPSDNEDEGVVGLIEKSDDDDVLFWNLVMILELITWFVMIGLFT